MGCLVLGAVAAMPTRACKQVLADTWVYSASAEANATKTSRKQFVQLMSVLQSACQTSGTRTVEARDAKSITIKSALPIKYDSAKSWLLRTAGDNATIFWSCAPVVAEHDAGVSTLTAPVVVEEAGAARIEPKQEPDSEPPSGVIPSVLRLAGPADAAEMPDPTVLVFKCLRLIEQRSPKRSQNYETSGGEQCSGEGTFGKVFACVHKPSGEKVALKFFQGQRVQ